MATVPTPNGANVGDVLWTDTGRPSGTTYFYRVAAYNAAGASVYSIWAKGTTLGAMIAAPTNLTATAAGGSQINLTWADNSNNETGFRIQRAWDAAFTVEPATLNVAANFTSYSDAGLAPASTYFYRIFAVDAAGSASAASNTASATTLAAPPAAPGNLVITAITSASITLGWKDNATNEQGFYVERSANGGTTWTRIATLGLDAQTYTDTKLKSRTSYTYRVQAYNADGVSAYSNTATGTTTK